jgi:hypothetical protein
MFAKCFENLGGFLVLPKCDFMKVEIFVKMDVQGKGRRMMVQKHLRLCIHPNYLTMQPHYP